MRVRIRVMALAVSLLGTVLLSGCAPTGTRGSEEQRRDDLVPLVRPLPMVDMQEPLVVDFTLLPPERNTTSNLSIGIRVEGDSGRESMDAAQAIRYSNLKAAVFLFRMDAGAAVPVQLVHNGFTTEPRSSYLAVGTDGHVSPVSFDSVEERPGTGPQPEPTNVRHNYLALAWARDVAPGRYRLSIRLQDPSDDLAASRTELLVGYQRKGK